MANSLSGIFVLMLRSVGGQRLPIQWYNSWQPLEDRIDSASTPTPTEKRVLFPTTQAPFLTSKHSPLFISLIIGVWKLIHLKKN